MAHISCISAIALTKKAASLLPCLLQSFYTYFKYFSDPRNCYLRSSYLYRFLSLKKTKKDVTVIVSTECP